MRHEPIRHHYIPQFILRNFCFDVNKLYYFDKKLQSFSVMSPRDVFMEKNLYRDEVNHDTNPVQIEEDFAAYEREVSQIIRERFLQGKDIVLSAKEDAILKLFFALMGFRSINTQKQFGEQMLYISRDMYRNYQKNENYLDLWKRNLGYAVNCRSIDQVLLHPKIDDPFKIFFRRDTQGYFGKYFAVVETDEKHPIVLSDSYPVVIEGTTAWGLPLEMYSICPISPNRVILLANTGVQGVPRNVLQLREHLFTPPKSKSDTDFIQLRVRMLSADEAEYLNCMIAENAYEGIVFTKRSNHLITTIK